MIKETIEFGVGVALTTFDLLARRRKDFIRRSQEVEERYPQLKKIADSVGGYESRFFDFIRDRLPFASKEDIADLAKRVDTVLKRKK